ncbi:hypothetical protein QBC39DRAFT_21690 [Podospora conica]|nr:hypothetical protein QBC39DRAFT_21690 [Schizothecium conicum]
MKGMNGSTGRPWEREYKDQLPPQVRFPFFLPSFTAVHISSRRLTTLEECHPRTMHRWLPNPTPLQVLPRMTTPPARCRNSRRGTSPLWGWSLFCGSCSGWAGSRFRCPVASTASKPLARYLYSKLTSAGCVDSSFARWTIPGRSGGWEGIGARCPHGQNDFMKRRSVLKTTLSCMHVFPPSLFMATSPARGFVGWASAASGGGLIPVQGTEASIRRDRSL